MSDIKLKPCPFCGKGILSVHIDYMIQCMECKTIFVQPQSKVPHSMLEIWNRRANNDRHRYAAHGSARKREHGAVEAPTGDTPSSESGVLRT